MAQRPVRNVPPGFHPVTTPAGKKRTISIPEGFRSVDIGAAGEEPSTEWPRREVSERTIGGFALNVPLSAARLFEPLLHPIDTATGMVRTFAGLIEKMGNLPPELKHNEQYINAVGQMMIERYGGWENLQNTLYEDPAGVVADISGIVSGVGGGLRGAAAVTGKAGKLAQTGRAVSRVGAAMDPLRATFRGGAYAVKVPAKIVTEILGVTTGMRGEPLRTAARYPPAPSPQLTAALRGKSDWMQTVKNVEGALQSLKDARGDAYRLSMREVFGTKKVLDLDPVKTRLTKKLANYRIGVSKKGRYDLSHSTIERSERVKVKRLLDDLRDWGKRPEDLTPEGVDALKRYLQDFYSGSGEASSLVAGVSSDVRKLLQTELPGYARMTKDYQVASDFIKQVQRELSAGTGQHPGTQIRKLASLFNQNADYRRTLLEALDQYIGDDIKGQVTGMVLNQILPSGMMGRLYGGAILGGAAAGAVSLLDPSTIAMAASTSPRAMGELMVMVARLRQASDVVSKTRPWQAITSPAVYRPGTYAGRAERERVEQPRNTPPPLTQSAPPS